MNPRSFSQPNVEAIDCESSLKEQEESKARTDKKMIEFRCYLTKMDSTRKKDNPAHYQ